MPPNDLQTLIDGLSATIDAKASIISLARLGPAAITAAPRLTQISAETTDHRVRAIILNALMEILKDSNDIRATDASRVLAGMLEQPRCRRVRRRITLTLAYIGRAAHPALPSLVRLRNRGARKSLINALSCAIQCIASDLLFHGSEPEQQVAIQELSQLRYYGAAYVLHDFLQSNHGSTNLRAAAHAAYTRPDQKHRITT